MAAPKAHVSSEIGDWYPQRSDLRYTFVATIEIADEGAGKQIVSTTSNLSRYGCHARTTTPFLPGTSVKLIIKHQGITFECTGRVVYAISGEGMGVHFENVGIAERVILKEWLLEVGHEELEQRLRNPSKVPISLSKEDIMVLVACVVGSAAIIAGAFVLLGIL